MPKFFKNKVENPSRQGEPLVFSESTAILISFLGNSLSTIS